MIFETGRIVLVNFPYTRLQGSKLRPVIVISPRRFTKASGNYLFMPLTTKPQGSAFALRAWPTAGLPRPSWVKPVVFAPSETFIRKPLGKLDPADNVVVTASLRALVDSRYLPRRSEPQ